MHLRAVTEEKAEAGLQSHPQLWKKQEARPPPPLMFAVLLLLLILHQVEPALWGLIKLSQLLLNTGMQSVAESAWSRGEGREGWGHSIPGLSLRGRKLGLPRGLWAGQRMLSTPLLHAPPEN